MKEEFINNVFQYGIGSVFAVILLYFMMRFVSIIRADHRKDYEGVTKRLNEVEDFQKTKLVETVEKASMAIKDNTAALQEFRKVVEKCKG